MEGGKLPSVQNLSCSVVNSLQLVPRSRFLDLHFRVGLVKGVLPDGIGSLIHQCVHHLECVCVCVDVLRSPGDIYTIVLTKIGLSPHTPPSTPVANCWSAVLVCGRCVYPGYGGYCNTHHTPAPRG